LKEVLPENDARSGRSKNEVVWLLKKVLSFNTAKYLNILTVLSNSRKQVGRCGATPMTGQGADAVSVQLEKSRILWHSF